MNITLDKDKAVDFLSSLRRASFAALNDRKLATYYAGHNDVVNTLISIIKHWPVQEPLPEEELEGAIDGITEEAPLEEDPKKEEEPPKAEKPKKKGRPKKKPEPKKETKKRDTTQGIDCAWVASLRSQGLTFERIADKIGCSVSSAHRAYNNYLGQFDRKSKEED